MSAVSKLFFWRHPEPRWANGRKNILKVPSAEGARLAFSDAPRIRNLGPAGGKGSVVETFPKEVFCAWCMDPNTPYHRRKNPAKDCDGDGGHVWVIPVDSVSRVLDRLLNPDTGDDR